MIDIMADEDREQLRKYGYELFEKESSKALLILVREFNEPNLKLGENYRNNSMCWCAAYGYIDLLEYLIQEHGADVHYQNDNILNTAVLNNQLDTVKYLIEKHGANVDVIDDRFVRTLKYVYGLESFDRMTNYLKGLTNK